MGHLTRLIMPMFAVVCLTSQASATIVREATLQELCAASALVVRGKVVKVEPTAPATRPTAVRTRTTLSVLEVFKGRLPDKKKQFTFDLPGGKLGRYGVHIAGMPTFSIGEEVVLLLEKTPIGYTVAGLQQGKFTITRTDGKPVVVRTIVGASMATRDATGRLVIGRPKQPVKTWPLQEFLQLIRSHCRSEVNHAR